VGLPLYLVELGISITEIGYIFGIAMIFYGILNFYLGSLSESSGRLKVGMLAIVGLIISSIIFGIIPLLSLGIAIFVFVIAKILFNLSDVVIWDIGKIRILDLSPKSKLGSDYGKLIFFNGIGYGLGLLLGGIALSILTFQSIFFVATLLLLVALSVYKKTGDNVKKPKNQRIFDISNLLNTSKTFKIVLSINTLILFGVYLVDLFGLPLFQKDVLEMSTQTIFIVLGGAWLVYGLLSKIGGKLYDQHGLKVFIIASLLVSITSVLMAFTKDVFIFSTLLILDYAFFAFADPARFALVGFVSRKNKGMLMSFFGFFSIISAAMVMLFFGKLVSLFKFEFIFILRGILQLVAIGLVFLIYNKIHKNR